MVCELRQLRRKVYSARRDFKDALDVLWRRFKELYSYERQLSLFESERVVHGPDFDLESLFNSFNVYLVELFNSFRVNSCNFNRDSWVIFRSFMDSWGVKEASCSLQKEQELSILKEVTNEVIRTNNSHNIY